MQIKCDTGTVIEFNLETLEGANLNDLNLHRAIFRGLHMPHTTMQRSDLRGADFDEANLCEADLSNSSLMTASFLKANLTKAILSGSRPISAEFEGANLEYANLEGADVAWANFKNANLKGANMNCQRMDSTEMEGAIYDNKTIWPSDFAPASKGAILVDS
jgi:uncharacterized protein YjbI with pentapeptide repeats